VDLLVDLPSDIGLLGLGRVQAELEAILGSKVDLVPAGDLKPAVRARAERDLVALTTSRPAASASGPAFRRGAVLAGH
jgi:predicted nucleotidyltransferase